MEGSREFCRAVCFFCGVTEDTGCLADLWIGLTSAVVQMGGLAGDDITIQSMCASPITSDLDCLRELNLYQRVALRGDMGCLKELLPAIAKVNGSLAWQVRVLLEDIHGVLA
eukprot:Skav210644  [mRNA]  locus=C8891178:237:572:- [translate_table: standard]